jgi:hypothetical protein
MEDIPLLVAKERAHGWTIEYRGTVTCVGSAADGGSTGGYDARAAAGDLLLGRAPQVAVVESPSSALNC